MSSGLIIVRWNAFTAAISKSKNRDANNYPQAWQQRYLAVDPAVTSATSSLKPLFWSDELFATCRWAQPTYDVKGIAGLLTLARSSEPVSALELRQIC
jgi:LuxR family transcriptional regulator